MTAAAMDRTYDIAILGGGQAGCLLARQLRRSVPDASVLLVERSRERSFKVGESTVDVAGKYLTKRLGLSSYLYQHHLPKNGLRFFFDREDRSGSLTELSEIGSTGIFVSPAFQIDRARFEDDLLRMNAADGVDVRIGIHARARPGSAGQLHELELADEDDRLTGRVRARWIVDATGRAGALAKEKDLRIDADLPHAAVWGRFRGVTDIDDYGDDAFRARVRHTPRMLSTNHFCYPGYWIWTIPLGRGVTSVGVVAKKPLVPASARTEEGFLAFLRSHRAIAELLVHAELVDRMSLGRLAYGTKRFFDGSERWALIGDAAAFVDPLYSPGADFIALENDWVTDLVRRDLAGEDIAERACLYDRACALRFESALLLYQQLYDVLGSFELFASKWDFDLACYANLWVEPYFADAHLELGWLHSELDNARFTLGVLRTFQRTFLDAEAQLRREGRFFEKNLGHLALDSVARFLRPDFGTKGSRRRAIPRVRDALQLVIDELHAKLGRAQAGEPIPFARFAAGRSLA